MALPNPGMNFTPFDTLPAADLNNLVENIEALSTGSGLNDGAITNAKLAANAAWATWTPTFTNLAGGTLNYAKYSQIGKTVHFRLKYTLAGAGVSGVIGFSPPVSLSADTATADDLTLTGKFIISGVTYLSIGRPGSATRIDIYAMTTSAAYGGLAITSATVPGTFVAGSVIQISGVYEAA